MGHGNKVIKEVGDSDRGVTRTVIAFLYYTKKMPDYVVSAVCSDHTGLLRFYLFISALASINIKSDTVMGWLSREWMEIVPFLLLIPLLCHITSALIFILSIHWASKRAKTQRLVNMSNGNAYQISEVLFLSVACLYPLIGAIIYLLILLSHVLWKNTKKYRQRYYSRSRKKSS